MAWYEKHISTTPNVQGGYPVVHGTRTPVRSILARVDDLKNPNYDLVLQALPHLTEEQVRAAIAYYAVHPDVVDEDIASQQAAVEAHLSRT